MDWTIRPYKEANHPPVPKLTHSRQLTAKAGDRVNLSAAGSTDPDGDSLTYAWFYYDEPSQLALSTGRSGNPLTITDADKANAWFTVPRAGRTGTMHIILAVTDTGTPRLTRYQRVLVQVLP